MNTLSKRHAGNLPVAQTLPAIPWFRPFCGMILLALLILMANKGLSQTVFNYTGTIQTYTVPPGITSISIEAKGAQGGGEFGGGKGAIIRATFPVTGGQVLKILVGENPVFQNDEFNITSFNRYNQGGGGGSFVWNDTSGTLMIAAGGGGGDNSNIFNGSSNGLDASLSPSGTNGNGIIYYGVGGQSGMGGQIGSVGPAGKGYGAGGAGWLTNGANASSFGCATPTGGLTPLNGGAGGTWSPGQFVFLSGGFGGGGGPQRVTTSLVNSTTSCNSGGGGGGGGYSGGGGGSHDIGFGDNCGGGGGGGSYSIGSGTNGSVGNTGHGQITIFSEPAGALNFDGANDFIHVPNGMNLSATSRFRFMISFSMASFHSPMSSITTYPSS